MPIRTSGWTDSSAKSPTSSSSSEPMVSRANNAQQNCRPMSMNKAKPCDFPRWLASVVLLSLGVSHSGLVRADSITEPATVFFGKVLGTGSGQPFQVTQGAMEWVIHKADGKDLILQTTLFPLHNGEFSYRLDVPHEAIAL